jgi:hypothetical protein
MDRRLDDCIRDCLDCHRVCLETVGHLSTGGRRVDPAHIRMLWSCAELARASAGLLHAPGSGHGAACAACAEVCDRSARYCDGFADDPQMAACAAACRRCAAACRQVAAAA